MVDRRRVPDVLGVLRLLVIAAVALLVIYPGTPVGWRLFGGAVLGWGVLLLVVSAAFTSPNRLAQLLLSPPRFRRSERSSDGE
ncbi:hypothetical protein GCM10027563_40610 [Parasphingorhabdus pacifica]